MTCVGWFGHRHTHTRFLDCKIGGVSDSQSTSETAGKRTFGSSRLLRVGHPTDPTSPARFSVESGTFFVFGAIGRGVATSRNAIADDEHASRDSRKDTTLFISHGESTRLRRRWGVPISVGTTSRQFPFRFAYGGGEKRERYRAGV